MFSIFHLCSRISTVHRSRLSSSLFKLNSFSSVTNSVSFVDYSADTEIESRQFNVLKSSRIAPMENIYLVNCIHSIKLLTEIDGECPSSIQQKLLQSIPKADFDSIYVQLKKLHTSCLKLEKNSFITAKSFEQIDEALASNFLQSSNVKMKKSVIPALLEISLILFSNVGRQSKFNQKLKEITFQNLHRQSVNTISMKNALFFMFLVNLTRSKMKIDVQKLSEQLFKSKINRANLGEMAVMCSAFFKTRTPIEDIGLLEALVKKLIHYLRKNDNAIDQIGLSCVTKCLSLSRRMNPELISDLADGFMELNGLSDSNFAHLGSVLITNKLYKENFCERCVDILTQTDDTRMKDFERILKCLVFFDHFKYNDPLANKLANIACKKFSGEIVLLFPTSYLAIVHYFAMLGIYLKPLIDTISTLQFIEAAFGNVRLCEENIVHYMLLRDSIEIEAPQFKYFSINFDKKVDILNLRIPFQKTPECFLSNVDPTKNERLLLQTYRALKEIYDENFFLKNILSFTVFPEMVIADWEQIAEIKAHRSPMKLTSKKAPCYVVIILNSNSWTDLEQKRLSAFIRLRIRLLERLGFKTVFLRSDKAGISNFALKQLKNQVTIKPRS